jgi:hypothetical protein
MLQGERHGLKVRGNVRNVRNRAEGEVGEANVRNVGNRAEGEVREANVRNG